jgi:hypothetical protein
MEEIAAPVGDTTRRIPTRSSRVQVFIDVSNDVDLLLLVQGDGPDRSGGPTTLKLPTACLIIVIPRRWSVDTG